jgi:hypothetical protein
MSILEYCLSLKLLIESVVPSSSNLGFAPKRKPKVILRPRKKLSRIPTDLGPTPLDLSVIHPTRELVGDLKLHLEYQVCAHDEIMRVQDEIHEVEISGLKRRIEELCGLLGVGNVEE